MSNEKCVKSRGRFLKKKKIVEKKQCRFFLNLNKSVFLFLVKMLDQNLEFTIFKPESSCS